MVAVLSKLSAGTAPTLLPVTERLARTALERALAEKGVQIPARSVAFGDLKLDDDKLPEVTEQELSQMDFTTHLVPGIETEVPAVMANMSSVTNLTAARAHHHQDRKQHIRPKVFLFQAHYMQLPFH